MDCRHLLVPTVAGMLLVIARLLDGLAGDGSQIAVELAVAANALQPYAARCAWIVQIANSVRNVSGRQNRGLR